MTENERILTQINKITQIGQAGINSVMPKAQQPALRQALKVQRFEYQSLGARAKNLAKAKGLEIQNSSKMIRRMVGMASGLSLMRGDTDSQIAGMMIQGNTRGMIKSLKDMHQVKNPDHEVSELAQKLLDTEIANIQQMEGFL